MRNTTNQQSIVHERLAKSLRARLPSVKVVTFAAKGYGAAMGKKAARPPSVAPPIASLARPAKTGRPSAPLDTRVVYRGDNREPLADLPDASVELISVDPPSNFNRNHESLGGMSTSNGDVCD